MSVSMLMVLYLATEDAAAFVRLAEEEEEKKRKG